MKKRIGRLLSFSDFRNAPASCADFFAHLPVLPGPRILLRPLRRRDARDIFSYASDPEVARYVLWDPHRTLADSRDYVRYVRGLYRAGLPASWGIVFPSVDRVIGTIGFMWLSEENRAAEIGYSLSREVWNQGIATEALSLVLSAAFAHLPLDRIEAQCDLRNPASARVMEKCGMTREGVLRHRLRNKGEAIDVALYAILRQDVS